MIKYSRISFTFRWRDFAKFRNPIPNFFTKYDGIISRNGFDAMEPSIPIRSGVYRKRNYIVFGLESSSLDPVTFSFPASSHCGPNTGACKTGHVVAVSGALRRWASESAGTRVRPSDVSIRVQLDHGPLEFFFFFFEPIIRVEGCLFLRTGIDGSRTYRVNQK